MTFQGFDKDLKLTGKTALVTGAAQGIGSAVCELFAERGANLVLVDLQDNVKETAEAMKRFGGEMLPLVVDVTDTKQVVDAVGRAIAQFGKIDILINNAGVVFLDDAENIAEADWDKTMAVNLKAPFIMSQQVGREMIKAGGGNIVNLASQAALIALDRHVAYCTSKAGILGMTKVLAMEWAEFNIRVNAISPTVVLTELGKKAWAGEVGEAFKKTVPIGRFAYPEEIAMIALFLASDAAPMITGENIVIDGGYTIK